MIGLWSALCLALLTVNFSAKPTHGVQVCGSKLSSLLTLVCPKGFGTRVKKSIDVLHSGGDFGAEDGDGFERWPFFTGIEGNSLTNTRRRRMGVVHECCLKACSLSELTSYCRPSAPH